MKEKLMEELIELNKQYQTELLTSRAINRRYYHKNTIYKGRKYEIYFANFGDFKNKTLIKNSYYEEELIPKEQLQEELIILNAKYQKKKKTNNLITRDYYRKTTQYAYEVFNNYFKGFADFKNNTLENPITGHHRKDLSIIKKRKSTSQKYVVSSIVSGSKVDEKFISSLENYCKKNKAKLILLVMRGVLNTDTLSDEMFERFKNNLATEYKFNDNLIAIDFQLKPQQVLTLTGLLRFGQGEHSLIVGHSKQFMQTIPCDINNIPHIVHSTGTISKPCYNSDRIGKLAEQDNQLGALIVEIEDNDIFHLRQIQADSKGGFYDLDKYYCQDKIKSDNCVAFVLGDYHSGYENKETVNCWKECIKLVNPNYIVFHDIFNGTSVSHHELKDIVAQHNRPKHLNTIEKELLYLGKELKQWKNEFSKSKLLITKGNHDAFLDRYLKEGRYVDDRFNHYVALKLALYLLEGKNPIEEYINRQHKIKDIIWLNENDSFIKGECELGKHGHLGNNGARGSVAGLELGIGNSITGHSHSPQIFRNTWKVGVSTDRDAFSYTKGTSSWLQTSAILHKNGNKQLINCIKGKWRL